MKKPNLFIVGAPKCGTTSLYYYLKQHPEVFMSTMKEPHFFTDFDVDSCHGLIEYVKDETKYLNLFAAATEEKVLGESSVSYLGHDAAICGKIYDFNPDAKIIIMLRDPVERAYSQYLMDVKIGKQAPDSDFLDVVLRDHEITPGRWCKCNLYLAFGLYAEPIRRYLNRFGEDQVRIFLQDDLFSSKDETMRSIFKFLQIDPSFQPGMEEKFNTYGVARNPLLLGIYNNVAIRSAIKRIVPDRFKVMLSNVIFKSRKKPAMSSEAKQRLQAFYREDIIATEQLIGRDLSAWYRTEKEDG